MHENAIYVLMKVHSSHGVSFSLARLVVLEISTLFYRAWQRFFSRHTKDDCTTSFLFRAIIERMRIGVFIQQVHDKLDTANTSIIHHKLLGMGLQCKFCRMREPSLIGEKLTLQYVF